MQETKHSQQGDLTVTALYTSMTWAWGGFFGAELLTTRASRSVFAITNAMLWGMKALRWKLPSLRHSLVQRHALIDQAVRATGAPQVLEFAAGLSQRGVEMSADPLVNYTELDLPAMSAKKRELLQRTAPGTEVLARPNFRLRAGNVETTAWENWPDANAPVCIIAEGLLMYLSAEQQQELWKRCARVVQRQPGSALVFDLVPFCEQPKPGLLGNALEFLLKRFTEGQSLVFDQRTRADVAAELRAAGFRHVEALEPRTAPREWNIPHLRKRTQTLVFVCTP